MNTVQKYKYRALSLFKTQVEELRQAADLDDDELLYEREVELHETPLAITERKMYKVELSWGGPADWVEVIVDEDYVESITYCFSDWEEYAKVRLSGEDFSVAREWLSYLLPVDFSRLCDLCGEPSLKGVHEYCATIESHKDDIIEFNEREEGQS